MISPFPAAHTWRLFLDFLQSSFLIQPGAKRRLALSSLGPFFAFVQKDFSYGTAYCLGGSSAVFTDSPQWGPSLERALQGHFFQLALEQPPLLITIWEENRSWQWGLKGRLEMTKSTSFSVQLKKERTRERLCPLSWSQNYLCPDE